METRHGSTKKGFFGALFDFSFSEFVTSKIIKVLYILAIIGAGITAVFTLIGGIAQGGSDAFAAILLAPVLFLFFVIYARIVLELVIVVFRIGEHVRDIAHRLEPPSASRPAAGPPPTEGLAGGEI